MRTITTLAASILLLAACSSTEDETLSGAGGAAGAPTEMSSSGAGGAGVSASELGGAPAPGTARDFEVNVGDRVFFAYDSSVIDDRGREVLQRQAVWLEQYPGVNVTIEGHADLRGTTDYNLALGERRASAARSYLEALGVNPGRMLTISYGEERPVDPRDAEDAYALNRRAVTVITVTQ
jgi:peptidoglycan-associated lipoprotein